MKLKYKGDFNLSSVQKSFKGKDLEKVYELSDTDGKYLLNTFKELFEQIEEKQIETEPKESPKKTETKTTRTKVKPKTETKTEAK
jgi:hypothetical protein